MLWDGSRIQLHARKGLFSNIRKKYQSIQFHHDSLGRHSTHGIQHVLLQGYTPTIQLSEVGNKARAAIALSPSQGLCYYPGKLHGGYQAFLLDQLFADCCNQLFVDCCNPPVTASLTLSYHQPVPPDAELFLEAWPTKVNGRKIEMEGSIKLMDKDTGDLATVVTASALFIIPRQ
ncbi:HotDog domain-containing protein [Penicillium canescens]|uniref:HotDog domain-containing protein n=2 Tax=Penicillium canescens TaxID=5083 RepID=A0AAD6N8C7_PENCN|nr:HotDog domain-containing protein [Penicillium canescens]